MKKNIQRIINILTFCDRVLIVFIIIAAVALYGILALNLRKSPGDIVVVQQNRVEVLQLTQKELNEDGIYEFKFGREIGYIEVKEKKVRMVPMDKAVCPQAICSETGWIEGGSPKTIVCVPNRLVVYFKNDKSSEIDGIAY